MNNDNTGFAKLFHPRGPLVTLPVPPDPEAAFAHIEKCLDAGWLVIAPGLEEGEQREEVGYVLRGACDTTPTLLLYSTNEAHSFSFLKVYLNTPQDIAAFEFASKMKLTDLPEYVGSDKPERGKSAKLDQYIERAKKPFGVVMKANPKYSESERAVVMSKNEIYKVPRRLFVRWVDQRPNEEPKPQPVPSTNHKTPKPQEKPRPGTSGPSTPIPTKSQPATSSNGKPPLSAAQKHETVINAYRNAKEEGKVHEWYEWSTHENFSPAQAEEQMGYYHEALARIKNAEIPF